MSKQHFTTDIQEVESLKREIQEAINRKVEGNGDCLFLQRQIEERCGFRIGNNTLRRVFGLLPASPPSKATLDILSEFLGYSGWDGFLSKKKYSSFKIDAQQYLLSATQKEKTNREELNTVLASANNLSEQLVFLREVVLIAIHKKDEQFITDLFKLKIPYDKIQNNDFDFEYLISVVSFEIRNNQILREKVIPEWAKDSIAHRLYFEFFVDIDYLVLHHDWVLKEYLLQKNTDEAKVFVNTLLFLKNWLSKDYHNCKKQYIELSTLYSKITPTDIHSIPYIRLLSYKYLWVSYISDDTVKETIRKEIKNYLLLILTSNNKNSILQLIQGYHNLGEILIWLREYHFQLELSTLFSDAFINYKNYSTHWNQGKINQMNAYCNLKIGKPELAKKLFQKTNLIDSLFQKDYDRIHHLIYKYEFEVLVYERKNANLLEEAKSIAVLRKMEFLVDWIERVRLG